MDQTDKNIVFIAIDDLFAYDQFRTAFGVTISTPNLDKLMAASVNFENAYASVAICAPSRAATMTGKSVFETGVHDNFTGLFDVADPSETWPAMIREAGYYTASSGKIFHSKGGTAGVQEVFSEPVVVTKTTIDSTQRTFTDGGKKWAYTGPDEDFNDYDVAQFGIEFLDRAPTDQPFMLSLGFDHPHTAYFGPERYFDLYPVDQIQIPTDWMQGDLSDAPAFAQQFVSQPRGGEPWSDLAEWKATVQGYLAAISHMDAEVGRFLDALAASEHAGDTAIMLYSDHGYQLGNKDHPVKFTLWEESAKAPLMLYDPSLEGGKTVTTPVSLMDIMPTMLELASAPVPEDLLGQSLLPFVNGDPADYTATSALTMMYGSFAIRAGDYRYIRYNDGGEELYNVVADPGQITNLATDPAYAARLADLRAELVSEANRAGALMDLDTAILLGTDGADSAVAQPGNVEIALGAGDDTYFVHGNTTLITELSDGGVDTVYYVGAETYQLPDHVEIFRTTLADNATGQVRAIGNDGDNIMYTGYYSSSFDGGAGNDQLYGGGWVEHTLSGGAGNDRIIGAKFADLLFGGDGSDIITGYNKNDSIFGGAGNDTITGDNDNDHVEGGSGDDTLWGGTGHDRVSGGEGDDLIDGDAGEDILDGGDGADILIAGAGDDTLDGGAGIDHLTATEGNNVIRGGAGADLIVLGGLAGHMILETEDTADADQVTLDRSLAEATVYRIGPDLHVWFDTSSSLWIEDGTTSTASLAFADTTVLVRDLAAIDLAAPLDGYGDQTLTGNGADNILSGNYGRDTINAKAGDDTLFGGGGDDSINASNGNDLIWGGDGTDSILGGNGNDRLVGGTGDDYLQGGGDGDRYDFGVGFGVDIVDDKGAGAGDLAVFARPLEQASFALTNRDLVASFANGDSVTFLRAAETGDLGSIEQFEFAGVAVSGDAVLAIARGEDVTLPPQPGITLDGSEGIDNLSGTQGADLICGHGGADVLAGAAGDDKIFAGDGSDIVQDGAGVDNLFGGSGRDLFVLAADGDVDSIKDFEGTDDRIDLTAWGVSSLNALDVSATLSGKLILRFGHETLAVEGVDTLEAENFVFATGATTLTGTDGDDRLFGTDGDDVVLDGAGVDKLWAYGGADLFVMAVDGVTDFIQDFDATRDRIDVSASGIAGFADLTVTQRWQNELRIQIADEWLFIRTADKADIAIEQLTADNFLFG